MATLPPITDQDLGLLRQSAPSHAGSEVLCRMAIFSYLKTKEKIQQALGNKLTNLVAWTEDDVNNQGFLTWADGVVVLAFRGTDSKSDWLKNADALFPDKHPLAGRRHDGFQNVWNQTPQKALDALNNEIVSGSQLWITGHSLGGAVATAAAAAFLVERPSRVAPGFGVMTIGAPRFGNKDFVTAYDNAMGDKHFFYVNQRDPVPYLPPKVLAKYRHSGTLQFFNEAGEHVEVTKEQVGLQSSEATAEGRAANRWLALNEEFNNTANTRDKLKNMVTEIGERVRQPELEIGDDGVILNLVDGALQGDSPWTTEAHDSGLYWSHINELAHGTGTSTTGV